MILLPFKIVQGFFFFCGRACVHHVTSWQHLSASTLVPQDDMGYMKLIVDKEEKEKVGFCLGLRHCTTAAARPAAATPSVKLRQLHDSCLITLSRL